MLKRLSTAALAAAILLVACGGGDDAREPVAMVPTTTSTAQGAPAPLSPQRAPPALTNEALFSWAEQRYSRYFGGVGVGGFADPFTYRYYADTQTYLGIAHGEVYVLGPVSGNLVLPVGSMSSFACQVHPADCDVAGDSSTTFSFAVGNSVGGIIDTAGDADWHAIFLAAGQSYVFDLEGVATGQGTIGDPLLRLFNGSGQQVGSDDDSGVSFNSRIACTPSTTGWHYLSAEGADNQTGSFVLSAVPSNVASPPCQAGGGGGSVDWESPFSAEEIASAQLSLAPGQAQGLTFQVPATPLAVELVFAAQAGANLYLTTADTLASCVAGGAFDSDPQHSFIGGSGFLSFTLQPGSYGLCARNTSTAANSVRMELRKQLSVVGFHFSQPAFPTVVRSVGAGARFVQLATAGDSFRTLIDGANSGGSFQIILASQVPNFLAGGAFNDIPELTAACGSSARAAPGLCELTGIEEYAVAYWNSTASNQTIVIVGRDYVPD